jgi:hypothetical protein
MKRLLCYIMIILFINSCSTRENKETINEFLLFGHTEFFDDYMSITDSTKLDIRVYFEYKKDSSLKIARKKFEGEYEYLTVSPKDTVGLDTLLNNILLRNSFYKSYSGVPIIYDGLYFTIYYKTSFQREFRIDYIPYCIPKNLAYLNKVITDIILTKDMKKTNKFEFNNIIRETALEGYKHRRIIMDTLQEEVEFKAPGIQDSNEK